MVLPLPLALATIATRLHSRRGSSGFLAVGRDAVATGAFALADDLDELVTHELERRIVIRGVTRRELPVAHEPR